MSSLREQLVAHARDAAGLFGVAGKDAERTVARLAEELDSAQQTLDAVCEAAKSILDDDWSETALEHLRKAVEAAEAER